MAATSRTWTWIGYSWFNGFCLVFFSLFILYSAQHRLSWLNWLFVTFLAYVSSARDGMYSSPRSLEVDSVADPWGAMWMITPTPRKIREREIRDAILTGARQPT